MKYQFIARPNINGNSAEDFREAYNKLTQAENALMAALSSLRMNVTNARNYQHEKLPITARVSDLDNEDALRTAYVAIHRVKNGLAEVTTNEL